MARAPGAYPDLEALIPSTYQERAPDTLDSGRNCTGENLGTLASDGDHEVRFAGGTWGFGGNRAAALVVFQAPGLTADDIADFYTASAKAANRTTVTGESKVDHGRPDGPAHGSRRPATGRRPSSSGRRRHPTWSTSSSPTTCPTRRSRTPSRAFARP